LVKLFPFKKTDLDVDDVNNYRPITNLCTILNIIKKLTLSQLRPLSIGSVNFGDRQSVYRSEHVSYSTETALLKITSDIRCAMGKSSVTCLLSLDALLPLMF